MGSPRSSKLVATSIDGSRFPATCTRFTPSTHQAGPSSWTSSPAGTCQAHALPTPLPASQMTVATVRVFATTLRPVSSFTSPSTTGDPSSCSDYDLSHYSYLT